jgi:hypothetical protein
MDTKRISSGLESLNDEQRKASNHHAGPLPVIASAGTVRPRPWRHESQPHRERCRPRPHLASHLHAPCS